MRDYLLNALTLARVSNLPTVWTNVLVAWTINATASNTLEIIPEISDLDFFSWTVFAYLFFGSSLVYAGGCTLNDAFDKKFDQKHNPSRPIPSGSISSKQVWILGIIELIAGASLLINGAGCNPVWVLALLSAILIYDTIHKKWVGSVIFMGLCRLFLWLAAASSSKISGISSQTWIWGMVLTGYIIGISLFARGESQKEKSANRFSILLLSGTPLTAIVGLVYWNQLDPTRVILITIVGLLVGWIAYSSVRIMKGQKKGAVGKGVSRLLAGICAMDATAVCLYSPILIAPVLSCLSIAVVLQKKFAAT